MSCRVSLHEGSDGKLYADLSMNEDDPEPNDGFVMEVLMATFLDNGLQSAIEKSRTRKT